MGSNIRHVKALLRRNLVFRKRAWLSSIFQLLLPSFMIALLLLIKMAVKDLDGFKPTTIPAIYPSSSVKPFSFFDYVDIINTPRECIIENGRPSISGGNPLEWPVPFVKCDIGTCSRPEESARLNPCEINILALAPTVAGEEDRMNAFKDYIIETYPQINDHTDFEIVQTFTDRDAINEYVRDREYGAVTEKISKPKIALAVLIGGSGKEYDYSIRTNSTYFGQYDSGRPVMITQPDTAREFNAFAKTADDACILEPGTGISGANENNCNAQYMYNGALTIQRLVGDFILSDTGASEQGFSIAENGISFADFPSKSFVQDGFYSAVAEFVPLLIVLGLLFPFASMVRSIVQEKEFRQKELMKMMSISESAIELSWFLSLYGFSFLSGLLATIFSTLFFEKASTAILFIFWQFTFIAIVVFSMFIASIFSKTPRATLVGIMAFFAGYFLTLSADIDTGNSALIRLVSLHPVTALAYGLQMIGSLEDGGSGLVPNTLSFTEFQSGYTFGTTMSGLVGCSIYFGIITWYINRVFPGQYGKALPKTFFLSKSYWFRSKTAPAETLQDWKSPEMYQSLKIESPTTALKQQELEGTGVHIRGLTKQFGDKTAISDLELSMYEGQVFALLGHNGAGKTTTINILTGMLEPTSGYAIIDGKSINNHMPEIRENLGICLQHDCLFDQLTVREHLQFFARVKGLYERKSFEDAEKSIDDSIRDVALFEKRNTFSKDLSGGMKRKLSLAIAFSGDSKVIFLDEPTSGMDPFSRRFIWNVIRQNRQDRCIILTTHFMDEADLLGDRIGIMAEGQLRCVGSSLFLKKEFGVGYQITIEKKSEDPAVDETVSGIVMKAVPEANVLSQVSSELSFQLPLDAASSFVPMFTDLDKIVERGEISMYGVSITTLEEVFLMVARGETGNRQQLASSKSFETGINDETNASTSHRSQEDISNSKMFARHVQCLLSKRAMNFKRDKKAWVCSTILPCLFALLGFMAATFQSQYKVLKPLELDLSKYNPSFKDKNDRYPTPVSNASTFSCQPAECFSFSNPGGHCGVNVSLTDYEKPNCTNIDISSIANALDKELFVINQDVSTMSEASRQLPLNYESDDDSTFGSTQYGAYYFTHTTESIIDGTNYTYSNAVEEKCQSNLQKFTQKGFNCSRFGGLGLVVSTNFTAPHASLLYQKLADEVIVEAAVGSEHSIKASIDPLPFTSFETDITKAGDSFSSWFYLVLSFPFITGAFATFIVQERMSKAKHLQTVAGVKPSAYWISSFLWDVVNYQFPLWIIIILMFAFDIETFTTGNNGANSGTILLLFFFGPAAAGFTYITTFFFKSPSSCNLFVIVFNFFIGFAGPLVSLILKLIYYGSGKNNNLMDIATIIEWILRIFPSFNFAKGLLFVINRDIIAVSTIQPNLSVYSSDILLIELIILVLQSVFYLILAIIIDGLITNQKINNWFCKKKGRDYDTAPIEDVDEDITMEAERILSGGANDDLIVLSELKKTYPNGKVAVDGLSLGIPAGQCFGLLGINGAGKTTTMAMLTAEFPPTSGDATLSGFSITTQPEETRRRIGYCPQFDAHFVNMTGREHVQLYAAIKGVPQDIIDDAVTAKLEQVGLNEFDSDRVSSGYSGGMRRKLSVACATIGNPKIVFLDEPSTGMDPVSRRDLWTVISEMVAGTNQTSVILTTHSMEECEALCPRIGIMAGGKMKCLGSAQHLKTRYGQGYQMELKIMEPTNDDEDYNTAKATLIQKTQQHTDQDVENGVDSDNIFLNMEETIAGVDFLSKDTYLSSKLNEDDATGYFIQKSATSNIGVSVTELAAFCTTELRLRTLSQFLKDKFADIILREREDTRMRFEVPSEGRKISTLFGDIEDNKERLFVSEYGISQTTLEQVFNMHAAAAEEKKGGTDDR